MSLLSWIGSMVWGPQPSRNGDFVPTIADIHQARNVLRHLVPTELADIILGMAQYYYVITVRKTQPSVIVNARTNRADVPILSVSLSDPRFTEIVDTIIQVSLVIEGHDQGWSGFQADHGTKNNSWTWYSIGTDNPATHEERLVTNLHAVSETQTHKFQWDKDSNIVQFLKESKVLEVWAHARFPGWRNHVERAELSIYCFPL